MPDPVNVARLREATLEDAEFMGELVEMFLTDAAEQLTSLERALAAEDWPSTRRTAHRLRGASGNVGAEELARLCGDLEQRSSEGVAVESSAGSSIRGEFERVSAALQDCVLQAKGARADKP
jgi:HPt (histidine-containing phosphotransfer) domain-containing protein